MIWRQIPAYWAPRLLFIDINSIDVCAMAGFGDEDGSNDLAKLADYLIDFNSSAGYLD